MIGGVFAMVDGLPFTKSRSTGKLRLLFDICGCGVIGVAITFVGPIN